LAGDADDAAQMGSQVAAVDNDEVARLRATIGRLSRRLRAAQAAAGLTPTQLSVLFAVHRSGPYRLAALAEQEGLNPTLLSRVVARLVEQGLLRRAADPADRRAAVVQTTAPGRRLCERLRRERNDALGRTVARLPAADRQALVAALPALESLAGLLKDAGRGDA
jgi:DNA-binding MarR family transcriptional regulator